MGIHCLHISMVMMSVVLLLAVRGMRHETEQLLDGFANSEASLFAKTNHLVYHMEVDKYKPGYVLYDDEYALKTTDGNITEVVTSNSEEIGYLDGPGEHTRFFFIEGFTQISPTQIIVSDLFNNCLRLVDRVSDVTSTFAGLCKTSGYTDGAVALFKYPKHIIVDVKDFQQILVADPSNKALRTVDVVSKHVGTFVRSDMFNYMSDLVQDSRTGHIYITTSKNLVKLSYDTKLLEAIALGIPGNRRSILIGLFAIDETTILAADRDNDRILIYKTDDNSWSTLDIRDIGRAGNSTPDIYSPQSILLTPSGKLLIGSFKNITSYDPVIPVNRVNRRLEFVADYSVDCSVVNSTVAWSLLNDIAGQRYTIIEALCGADCSKPGKNAKPLISCDNEDELKIRWPTDIVFGQGVVSVLADIRLSLENKIRDQGVTLDVVVFGANPLVVYPNQAATSGYVRISLSDP